MVAMETINTYLLITFRSVDNKPYYERKSESETTFGKDVKLLPVFFRHTVEDRGRVSTVNGSGCKRQKQDANMHGPDKMDTEGNIKEGKLEKKIVGAGGGGG